MIFEKGKRAIAKKSNDHYFYAGEEIYLFRDTDATDKLFIFVNKKGEEQLLESHEFNWVVEDKIKGVVDMREDNNSENPYVENEDVEAVANRARMQFLANLIDQRLESGFYKTNYDEFKELVDDYIECKKKDTENSKEYVKKLKK